MRDSYGREIDYARISLTENCQLQCTYCVSEEKTKHQDPCEKLSLVDILEIVDVLANLGVKKIKLTGGEPLLYPQIIQLISSIKQIKGITQVTLTTNGLKLSQMMVKLTEAGLDGVNISLDTLDEASYRRLTRHGDIHQVLKGIEAAVDSGLTVKINCVLLNKTTPQDILSLIALAQSRDIHVRFIEWMPIGRQNPLKSLTEKDILNVLKCTGHTLRPYPAMLGNGPARYIEIEGYIGKVGFISAISQHFCDSCNRLRITSDGYLKTCLAFDHGVDLKDAIRSNTLESAITAVLKKKPRRHAFGTPGLHKEQKSMIQIGG